MRVLGCNCFRHVLGQLELIGKGNTLLWWAKARVSLDSPPDVPKLCGPTQQSRMLARCVLDGLRRAYITVGEIGQCEAWVQLLSACSGPTRTHRQGQRIPMVGQYKNFA